jgi:transposase
VHDIEQLKRAGLSVSAISAATGYDRKTVRKYLDTRQAVPVYGPRSPRPGKLEPFRDYIEERLSAGAWNAVVLLRELKQRGYGGGYSILKGYLQPKRQAAREGAVRRFETPPGHQAQVDWGELGTVELPDAERQRLYGFVFTLGHSRAMFADVALDQQLSTLLAMHEAAFSALGGVPREVLYDRMKTVATGVDDRGEIKWQPLFLDFARYWGFVPRLCRAYRPQTKGKVESGIKYVRRNFLCGRTATSVADLREQLLVWNLEVALPRVHGTTHRVVREAWQEELSSLQPCAGRLPFPHAPAVVRRVSRDAYVSYQSNRYPVPWEAAGREVTLRVTGEQLEIRAGGVLLATHALCLGRHQVLSLPGHYTGLPAPAAGPPAGKARITVTVAAPEVEVRPLSAYEALAEGIPQECAA